MLFRFQGQRGLGRSQVPTANTEPNVSIQTKRDISYSMKNISNLTFYLDCSIQTSYLNNKDVHPR